MQSLFKRLTLHSDKPVAIFQIPSSHNSLHQALSETRSVIEVDQANQVDNLLAFVHRPEDVEVLATSIQGKLFNDPYLWIAYPKKTSSLNTGTLTRDIGWSSFKPLAIRPVGQFALDDDYSLMRFRRSEMVKNPKSTIVLK